MANEDHQKLAQYIKDVHIDLRRLSTKLGPENAWKEHCKKKDVLHKYAECMEKLATSYWENNCASISSEATSRIEWAANFCYEYFIMNSWKHFKEKEVVIANKINVLIENEELFSEPLKLIDVGSCYNPFRRFAYFDVFAIDLYPANSLVFQCDFLTVDIGSETVIDKCNVIQIKQQSFDVVTFCFLLEYIPNSDLRILACKKAYSLLKTGGLLIINTPDSKHVGANSKLMKCWRYMLANIGFNRIKYEKFKHMHCMAFRKSLHNSIAERWALLHRESYMELSINIPQDFHDYDVQSEKRNHDNSTNTDYFKEMVFYNNE